MKKHSFHRMLSALLCLVMTVSVCSFGAQASLEDPFAYDVTIAKGEDDYRLHFPDIVLIPQEQLPEKEQADYPEGKLLVAYYQNKGHVPESRKIESMGWIEMVESKDSGKTWSEPVNVVTPQMLLDWGVATKELPLESRDPNFAILSDGTLLLTFFTRNDGLSNEIESYIIMSHDGGVTWGEPMMIQHDYEGVCAKRGDITQFANGDVLVPVYKDPEAYSVLYSYDSETKTLTKKWEAQVIAENQPDPDPQLNEVSYISAPTEEEPGRTYAFAREPGYVYESMDYGKTWNFIGQEYPATGKGTIVQPGLKLLPDGSIFATFALSSGNGGRPIYGKRFYPELGWDATEARLIYDSNKGWDMADPSAVLLADGETLLTVYYVTGLQEICGTFSKISDYETIQKEDFWLTSRHGRGYISGYPDGTFGLDNLVTRGEMAQMLYNLLDFGPEVEPSHSYTDLEGAWAEEAVGMLCAVGILEDEGGEFGMNELATRAELVVALSRMLHMENETTNRPGFKDMEGHELEMMFRVFKSKGILSGAKGDPDGNLKRQEIVCMINAAIALPEEEGASPWSDVKDTYTYCRQIRAATMPSCK